MDAVIVTYNSELDVSALVSSTDLREVFSRVLVVDNASQDATVDIARAAGFDVLERTVNGGFGAAANDGVWHTTADSVAILNPDIHILDKDLIPRLETELLDPTVGVVAPALELPDGRIQDSAREVPLPVDLFRRRMADREYGMLHAAEPMDVPWVVGAFMVVRREAFDAVGGFDPRFQLYFEDVDLCVRLRRRGWSVRFVPTARANHRHNAASQKSVLAWSTRQHIRSAGIFYSRHPRHILRRNISASQFS